MRMPSVLPDPQPLYLGDAERPLCGCLHLPAAGQGPVAAVLVCAPLGHEDQSTHRALRRWAGTLAEAGLPVLRFDYPGAGDSADLPEGAPWVEAMLGAVHLAADALKQRSGAPRLVLLGLRAGALLAVRAARQREDVEALVALLPVQSGRAWLRECRLLNGDMAAPASTGDAEGVDLGGLWLDAAQTAALSALDANGPADSLRCRVLVIERDDMPPGRYTQALQASGAAVEVQTLAGLEQVVAVAHSALLPSAVDTLSRDWLLQHLPAPGPATRSDQADLPGMPADLASVPVPGGAIRVTEQLVLIGHAPTLAAVLSRADDADAAASKPGLRRGLLLLSSGAERRSGPNRLWTPFARHRAARGEVVLRLDLAGIGDSTERPLAKGNVVYEQRCVDDIAAALAWLRQTQGVGPCVVGGICSGAFHAWRAALAGLPIQAVVPVNPLVFHWQDGMPIDPLAHAFGQLGIASGAFQSMRDPRRWLKLLRGQAHPGVILRAVSGRVRGALHSRARHLLRAIGVSLQDDLASELRSVARAGVPLHFVFSDQEPGRTLLSEQGGAIARRLMSSGQLQLHAVAGADHTFIRQPAREALYAVLDRVLDGLTPVP